MGDAGNRLTGGNTGGLHASAMVSDLASNGVVPIFSIDDRVRAGIASASIEGSVLTLGGGVRSGPDLAGRSCLTASGARAAGGSASTAA